MTGKSVHLTTPTARETARRYIDEAEPGSILTIKPATRSLEQNAKFHAICEDYARSKVPFAGKPRTAAQWKVLLVSGHAAFTKEGSEIIPGLEGEFVNIRESTALMSKRRGSSLIEYSIDTAALLGVGLSEPRALETESEG